jgi:GMP synthase (glutamine-hydrolysing)
VANTDVRPGAGRILVLVHQANAGVGHFDPVLAERGYTIDIVNLAEVSEGPDLADYQALLVMGGSPQVDQEDIHPWLVVEKQLMRDALEVDLPILGVCLGAQLLADITGGWVGQAPLRRRGWGDVRATEAALTDPVFSRVPAHYRTLIWHAYEFKCPPNATELAHSTTSLQAFRINDKRAWGVQYHPEVNPKEMAGWIAMIRAAGIEPESSINRWAGETELYEDEQRVLAEQICSGFLDQVEKR